MDVVTVEREDVTEIRSCAAVTSGVMAVLVERVVVIESPIHVDEVDVRLRTEWGLQRAGGRIQAAVERGVELAASRRKVVRNGDSLLTPGAAVRVRDSAYLT